MKKSLAILSLLVGIASANIIFVPITHADVVVTNRIDSQRSPHETGRTQSYSMLAGGVSLAALSALMVLIKLRKKHDK